MSAGGRVPLEAARTAALSIVKQLDLDIEGGWAICGSIRRGRDTVGDIDLVAPLPDPRVIDERPGLDRLCRAIVAKFEKPDPSSIFGMVKRPEIIGFIHSGVKPGFRSCCLEGVFGPVGQEGPRITLPIQIHRYVPGPLGNRGWIELLRTGPAGFGEVFLGQWAKWNQLAPGRKASEDGFLRDAAGKAVPTPTEEECFERAGLRWIEPAAREPGAVIRARVA